MLNVKVGEGMKEKKKNRPAAEKPERKAQKPAEKKDMAAEEEHIRNTEQRYGESQGGVSDGLKGGSRF
jgi:hypothetical protein